MNGTDDPLAERLARAAFVVLDGALATELERRGFDLRDELWSARVLLERPDAVRAVHASYLAAGADVITTSSYQATPQGLARRGLSAAQVREVLERSVQLACDARDEYWASADARRGRARPLIAASIGSYGAFLADGSEFRGDYALGEDELVAFHRERVAILAASPADVLAFETIPSWIEARAIARVLGEFPAARAWISFSCRDERHIAHGELLADCARFLEPCASLIAIGVNCAAPRLIAALVRELAAVTRKPIVAYPNSGETWDARTRSWSGTADHVDFAREAATWLAAGARVIGGCCRTTPRDIADLRALANARESTRG